MGKHASHFKYAHRPNTLQRSQNKPLTRFGNRYHSPLQSISSKLPPSAGRSANEPPAIVDFNTFCENTRWDGDKKKSYLEINRVGSQQLDSSKRLEMETVWRGRFSPVDLLYSNNAEARIDFANVVVSAIERHEVLGQPRQTFFVTINPARFGTLERDAAMFKVRSIQGWVREKLPGFDFVGMVEAAFFERGVSREFGTDNMISWHVHLIVWNTSYSRLNRALKKIRQSEPSFVAVRPTTDCRTSINVEDVVRRALYMLKVPQKAYHVYRDPTIKTVDPATGEILAKPTTQKRPMRPGQRIKTCRFMADRYIDKLFFGQGEGTTLRKTIVDRALLRFNADLRTEQMKRDAFRAACRSR